MTDIPIIFSAPMVRALLAGRKTMTRRLAWTEPKMLRGQRNAAGFRRPSPWQRVTPGARLWVREAWAAVGSLDPGLIVTRADYPDCVPGRYENVPQADQIKWRPSIHMPRSASRLTLTLTATKTERLQDITDADARAEGIEATDFWREEHPPSTRPASALPCSGTRCTAATPGIATRRSWPSPSRSRGATSTPRRPQLDRQHRTRKPKMSLPRYDAETAQLMSVNIEDVSLPKLAADIRKLLRIRDDVKIALAVRLAIAHKIISSGQTAERSFVAWCQKNVTLNGKAIGPHSIWRLVKIGSARSPLKAYEALKDKEAAIQRSKIARLQEEAAVGRKVIAIETGWATAGNAAKVAKRHNSRVNIPADVSQQISEIMSLWEGISEEARKHFLYMIGAVIARRA